MKRMAYEDYPDVLNAEQLAEMPSIAASCSAFSTSG